MQNALLPQKAGGDGARRRLRTAPLIALAAAIAAAADPVAATEADGPPDAAPAAAPSQAAPDQGWLAAVWEAGETDNFVPAAAQPNWAPAAAQDPPPAPPPAPAGARNSEAAPGEPGAAADDGADGGPGRVTDLVAPREQDLASLPFPAFVATDATAEPPIVPGEPAPPPTIHAGETAAGVIATLTITRRVAPEWVTSAVGDDRGTTQVIAATTSGLPDDGLTRQVSIAWADLDGDGVRDGHLYRIDNANDLAVTVQVRFAGGALLPGGATVAGDSAAFIWVPLAAAATLQFLGTDSAGDAIAWTRATNTQNTTDMTTTTVRRSAWAGETHQAGPGEDVVLFGPGEGVDAILGYDTGQDSVHLAAGTTARVVDVAGTAALLVGPTNREGLVFDGIAYSASLTLDDLNVVFV
jgi:hypothetical protein